jgi:predicted ATPase
VRSAAPVLLPDLPLLASLVAADVEPTPETTSLQPQFRRARLHRAALQLLRAILDAPALILIEDAHWMDEATSHLLAELAENCAGDPWLLCSTRRDVTTGFVVPAGAHIDTLVLQELAAEQAAELAGLATESTPLATHDMRVLVDRSGGNPLFLTELVAAAAAAGGIDDLPGSVEAVIAARIDHLPAATRSALRHLAVLGQTFPRWLADAVLPAHATLDDARLDAFLVRDEPESLRFRHALIRDAAYGVLPYKTRRRLHAAAGARLARDSNEDTGATTERLSFHFLHARQFDEAWRHSMRAAEDARAIFANAAAAELYERAITAARHLDGIDDREMAAVWELLGDVRDRMGRYADAAEAYRAARRGLADDPVASARLMLKLAWQHGWLRRYSQSLRWIRRGLAELQGIEGQAAARQRAQLEVWYGHFLQEQGRHADAITHTRAGIAAAEASGESEALAHAYRTLDCAHVALGEIDLAVHSEQALAIYEQLDDLPGQAAVLNNMGAIAYLQGRWNDALVANQRASEIWTRIGDDVSVVFSSANTAEVLFDQGRIDESRELMRTVLRVSVAAGHRSLAAFARRYLGRAAALDGNHDEAMTWYDESLATYIDIGARVEVTETQIRVAEAHLLHNDPQSALVVADQALQAARGLGGIAAQTPTIHRVRGEVMRALGDADGARAALETGLRAARSRDATFEVALCLRSLATVLDTTDRERALGCLSESDALLDRLGVVAVPELVVQAVAV